MKRIVVHIGAQRTGSDAIHKGLFANLDVFARQGVLVPTTGRLEMSPQAVRHHLLPWSLDSAGEHPHNAQVWEALADEIERSQASTVLLSSELFAPVAADPVAAPRLLERLHSLSDDVTLAFLARDQLGLLNSLYCHRVKSFQVTCDFDTYLDESADVRLYDLAEAFRPWYDAGAVGFVAVPWDEQSTDDALAALLAACAIPMETSELVGAAGSDGDDLGPVGIEATRLLGAYLRGRFPDFRPGEPAARRLRRRAANAALAKGWCEEDFWGWTPRRADEAVARYAASNQEFARRTWGGDWSLPARRDRERNVAELVELNPISVNRVHRFLTEMEKSFARLRTRQAAA